jgi:hypothetical protein
MKYCAKGENERFGVIDFAISKNDPEIRFFAIREEFHQNSASNKKTGEPAVRQLELNFEMIETLRQIRAGARYTEKRFRRRSCAVSFVWGERGMRI